MRTLAVIGIGTLTIVMLVLLSLLFTLAEPVAAAQEPVRWYLLTPETDTSPARYAAEEGPCAGEVAIIWGYDAFLGRWFMYDPDGPASANDLGFMSHNYAYFVACKTGGQVYAS